VCTKRGVTENPRGDIESLPRLCVSLGCAGFRNDCIDLSDGRSLGSQISAAALFEPGRGG
jgi:hypothetical protein